MRDQVESRRYREFGIGMLTQKKINSLLTRKLFGICIMVNCFFTSCHIHYGFASGTKGDAKTVSVQFFQVNAALAKPTAGQIFTEALKDIMQAQGKLELLSKGGDLNFEGTITGYSVSPVALTANDQSAANRLTMTVSVKFTNGKDEKKNFESSFSRFADFQSSQNLSSVEDDLITEITKQIVQDIYNRALGGW